MVSKTKLNDDMVYELLSSIPKLNYIDYMGNSTELSESEVGEDSIYYNKSRTSCFVTLEYELVLLNVDFDKDEFSINVEDEDNDCEYYGPYKLSKHLKTTKP